MLSIFLFSDSTKNGFNNYLLKRKIRCILTAKTPTLPQRDSSWPLLVFWAVWATTSHYLITPFLFWSSGDQMFVLSESQWANSGFFWKDSIIGRQAHTKTDIGGNTADSLKRDHMGWQFRRLDWASGEEDLNWLWSDTQGLRNWIQNRT